MTERRKTCSMPECGNPHYAFTWCMKHYKRWRTHGDPNKVLLANRGSKKKALVCSVEGCGVGGKIVRGWCQSHYLRWRRWGDPLRSQHDRFPCTIEGCERDQSARGYCTMHYERWRLKGDPGGVAPSCAPRGSGSISSEGYRIITVNGRKIKEHRHVMEQILGRPLLPREDVHHRNGVKTDNRPENLELWVSQPRGQRVSDLVAFVVERYREAVVEALGGGEQFPAA